MSKEYTLEEFEAAKKKLTDRETALKVAEGRLKEVISTLQKDFGVETLEDGDKLLKKLDDENAARATRFQEGMAKLEREYKW